MTETLDDTRAVDADVPCARCGYNVRGLGRDGRCPECGESVAQALVRHAAMLRGGVPLWMSSPRWVRRLSLGCWLVLLGGAAMAGDAALKLADRGLTPRPLSMALWFLPHLLTAVGLWVLGTPEARAGSRADRVLPALVRAAAVSQAAMIVVPFIALRLAPADPVRHWWHATLVLALFAAAGSAAGFAYLARLASRMSRTRLRRWAVALAVAAPVASLVQAGFFFQFQIATAHFWIPSPQAVLVCPHMWALLPYRLVFGAVADPALIFWGILAMLTILCGAVLTAYALSLRAAAGDGNGIGAVATPPGATGAAPASPSAP